MDIAKKAREAIVDMIKTDEVIIERMNYDATLEHVVVMAYVGDPNNGLQQFDMHWIETEQRFEIDNKFNNLSLQKKFICEYNHLKLERMSHSQLISLLKKANKRRKAESKRWKKKARWYREDFIRERDAQARTCANFRKYMDDVEAREGELQRREREYQQWRDRVDELVNKEAQGHKDLYAVQECLRCKEKRWRKKYRQTYSGMPEFCGKYINIVDDMMRQKNLPDNIKARLCDMRIAFIESREFLDNMMKRESKED